MFNPLAKSLHLNQIQSRATQARLLLEKEKADTSLWARLKDSLTHTHAESEDEAAQIALWGCENEIVDDAPEWVEARVLEMISGTHTPETRELMGMMPFLSKARARFLKVKTLRDLAKTAVEELRDAVAVCDNASAGELMDMMSTTRPSKSLHDNEIEEAKYAINRAHHALVRVGSEIEDSQVPGIDDADTSWWTQTLDFEGTSMSGLNLSALESAKEICKKTVPRVEEVFAHLETATRQEAAHLGKIKSAYSALEAPFRQQVLTMLPENIRDLLTKRKLCLEPADHEIKISAPVSINAIPKGRLDLDVIKRSRQA